MHHKQGLFRTTFSKDDQMNKVFRFFKLALWKKSQLERSLEQDLFMQTTKEYTVYYFFVPGCGYSVFPFLFNKTLIQLHGVQGLFELYH